MLALCLGGCGSVEPLPQDVFLRLPAMPAAAAPAAQALTSGTLRVAPLKANGLFKERALVRTDEAGVVLEQHRYRHWQDNPEVLLQLALADYLRAASAADIVTVDPDRVAALEIAGRIEAFELVEAAGGDRMRIALVLTLRRRADREPLLERRYEDYQRVADSTSSAAAAAMGSAARAAFGRFLADVAEITRSANARAPSSGRH